VVTFSGEICYVAFSSVALSSISEGSFSVSCEGPASVPAWITELQFRSALFQLWFALLKPRQFSLKE
jgi:hypothetical protein